MGRAIGVLVRRYIWVGVVEGTALGEVRRYPAEGEPPVDLRSLTVEEIVARIRESVVALSAAGPVDSVGAGFPGIVRNGVIDESPNLGQFKGERIQDNLAAALKEGGIEAPVTVINHADALAAGIAATRGAMERLVRVWHLGDGVGFGRYPRGEGVWEAGHVVVTLDPKERYCGCGGQGHLESIVGYRAMRLRFLDLEPEEVFAAARQGEPRATEFVKLWHRALAAATATMVHLDGPGRFYLAGPLADFADARRLGVELQEMVKMSPLQGSYFETVPNSHDLALIGAGVTSGMG
jgi:predicted NBD/HSP70 family sugar kinase